ncbi:hypothetical protein NQD34_007495 [Periophthalmus magnuspinnatus]|nr:hypothetical protein NQD34_007495 [Periophthalmus magnuspinnatus]
MLKREADAAVAEADAIKDGIESRRSVSDRAKRERTNEYVQSQMNYSKPQSPPPVPTAYHQKVLSDATFITWHSPEDDISDSEPPSISSKPELNNHDTALPIQSTSGPPKVETEPKVEQK